MRIRPLAALSVAAVSVLLLTSCSAGAPDATQSPSAQVADLCDAVAPSGDASEAVTVEGEPGAASQAVFTAPLEISELQSTVVTEGEGDAVEAGELVNIAFTAFSAETGEELGSLNYEPGQFLPQQISADNPIGQVLGCATPGTRVVATFPATETNGGEVYVFDFLETVPDAAWGTEQPAPEGLPEVELADDGEPTITVPDADAPTEVELATLKQGDGETVEPGDTVLVQYTGVKWSDNEVFDSSWEAGTPTSFQTTGVVDGFRQALEGQTVGSQVLVVIPPEFGYGAVEGNELQEETLVFVVDILGVQHAAPTTVP
ncbi:peptidylprolyl isomerase [Microbacterium sp. SLBN-154]|uniref:FKBP-type peptidyl-prolyl cis-trans isomerase n=1 Tax=Microbacterium sp. SLBN-154 TaxID=2768458 RepID=UPI0011510AAD|nr:FKBP-type peptidyl-prolyl cis-trans isomerase [Microbacterium sp. SLBN-154]TQK19157.1 peptidylprolyl isomerase [Microbacterium sp. SLBN-154]